MGSAGLHTLCNVVVFLKRNDRKRGLGFINCCVCMSWMICGILKSDVIYVCSLCVGGLKYDDALFSIFQRPYIILQAFLFRMLGISNAV